jgi:O-antigen/teichoic acid export membrane protein
MLWIKPVWVPTLKLDLYGLKALLPYSSKLAGSRILDAGSTRFFELGLGALLGSVALGVYSVGSRITQIAMQMLSSVVLDVAHSALSRVSSSTEKLQSAYLNGVVLSSMVAVPAFVLLSALSREICETVFGPQWVQSSEILWAIALLSAVLSVQYMNGAVLSATAQTGKVFVISLCKLLAAMAALYLGFGYGVDGVAYFFLIFNLFVAPVSFYLGIRAIDLRFGVLLRELWPFLVAAIFAYLVIDFSREYVHSMTSPWFALFLLGFLGLVVYTFSLLLTARRRVVGIVGNLARLKKGEGL